MEVGFIAVAVTVISGNGLIKGSIVGVFATTIAVFVGIILGIVGNTVGVFVEIPEIFPTTITSGIEAHDILQIEIIEINKINRAIRTFLIIKYAPRLRSKFAMLCPKFQAKCSLSIVLSITLSKFVNKEKSLCMINF